MQQDMVAELGERAEAIRKGSVDPSEDNMLKITNEGRKLALDQRLMNEMLEDNENGKVGVCANNIYKILNKTQRALWQKKFIRSVTAKPKVRPT